MATMDSGSYKADGRLVRLEDSPLANPDIVPAPASARTWNWWHIACLWIGMAVCIPTYMLAAGLIAGGMSWGQALLTILVGNAIVLIPLALNAHAGTKYGVPFPVLIRSSFGTVGAHIPSILRGLVACGWFGIQTWIGGAAIYEMVKVVWPGFALLGGGAVILGINLGQFIAFMVFWALHMWIVYAGYDSIKKLESWGAPILIVIGLALFGWAWSVGGGFGAVLDASRHFATPTVQAQADQNALVHLRLHLLTNPDGSFRATKLRVAGGADADAAKAALALPPRPIALTTPAGETLTTGTIPAQMEYAPAEEVTVPTVVTGPSVVAVEFTRNGGDTWVATAAIQPAGSTGGGPLTGLDWVRKLFLPFLTAMVGFWATLSLNIPDFTRYARSQRDQFVGQATGLPATMTFYAFIGIFATCASVIAFPDVLVTDQAPWDPVKLLARFDNPVVILLSMFGLALATITTNVAANIIAPAVGFSNLAPKRISVRLGGFITGFIGIAMMPWKLLETVGDYIFTWLIGYSMLLGAIAGIMIADYFVVRRMKFDIPALYDPEGEFRGINPAGVIAFVLGVLPNLPGFCAYVKLVDPASVAPFWQELYTYAWFVSFGVGFAAYIPLARVFRRAPRPEPAA